MLKTISWSRGKQVLWLTIFFLQVTYWAKIYCNTPSPVLLFPKYNYIFSYLLETSKNIEASATLFEEEFQPCGISGLLFSTGRQTGLTCNESCIFCLFSMYQHEEVDICYYSRFVWKILNIDIIRHMGNSCFWKEDIMESAMISSCTSEENVRNEKYIFICSLIIRKWKMNHMRNKTKQILQKLKNYKK